ncbi:hypothetical protein ILUMI_27427 [Ignelater luminosus]|uniref:Calponin-homology (CH) domain-containing protein n=1 Tax=Ignelater luminosus TaxID=2038154 RepID=A0A8K0C6K3_IGNLU|nr:hypothetical protein ILUMI_27427 [Ignelater luminosus]
MSNASGLLSFEEEASLIEYQNESVRPETSLSLKRIVRVVLYGEAEYAGIIVRPDSLDLTEIPIGKPETRELLLINRSSSLPIIFSYKKVCFVDVEPKSGLLPPSGNMEVGVTVNPSKIGLVKTKITFDLLYFNRPREGQDYVLVGNAEIPITFNVLSVTTSSKPKFNMGITPEYIKEVGFKTDDIRFNTLIETPKATLVKKVKKTLDKNDDDLIAFPNDRPKSLRPWKSPVKCRTICAGIPRLVSASPDTYELSSSKTDLKRKEHSYYQNYTRQEGERLRKLQRCHDLKLSDYTISNKFDLLLTDAPRTKCKTHKDDEKKKSPSFIPLSPLQLNKVKVYPSYIKIGKAAQNSISTRTITISNQNNFSIRIFAKSRKPVVNFPDGEHQIIKPHNEIDMKLNYNSDSTVGRHNLVIDFIVNDNHTFPVSMNIDVVQRRVRFDREDVTFESDQCPYIYLDVSNPLNVPIAFQWQVPDSCFLFEPSSATIPPRRHITCLATYVPNHSTPSGVEVTLWSEYGRNQTVNVTVNLIPPKVTFKNPKITFDDIPLNLPLRGIMVLKNLGNEPVTFAVLNPKPMRGISITPTEGVFQGYSEQIFTVYVKIPACITFNCVVEIEVQKVKTMKFQISGNVIYPQIVIKPEILQLRKIVPNSFERQVFVIMNRSTAKATVEFRLDDYVEYTILESHNFDIRLPSVKKIELEANQQKELYLHFNPMGAASYCFYLPIVINDLLGPVFLNMPESENPITYTSVYEEQYILENRARPVPMPKKLPLVSVSSGVGGDLLRFSKLHWHFKYFSCLKYNSETEHEIKIWNSSKDNCHFCIRTDEVRHPFSIFYVAGKEIEMLPNAIVGKLRPDEDVILKVIFTPTIHGEYYIKLPIYLRNYLQGSVFNYMTFTGLFQRPTIIPTEKIICLEPVPLKCESEYSFYLKNDYHSDLCTISVDSKISELTVTFPDEPMYDELRISKEIRVFMKCTLTTAKYLDTVVKFWCTCGGECYVNVKGCSENCSVTTHAFVRVYTNILFNQPTVCTAKSSFTVSALKESYKPSKSQDITGLFGDTVSSIPSMLNVLQLDINYNESCFPVFPTDHNDTDYAQHMRCTITATEEWLFHQCFYCKNYYKIPEGFATLPEEKPNNEKFVRDKKKQAPVSTLKYVELLITLAGPDISKYVPVRKIPEDPIHRINYMYNVYSRSKEFLIRQGGWVLHIFPEHLLNYSDYEIFMKSILPNRPEYFEENFSKFLDEYHHYYISKQSWMDFILQTYKVLVLARVRIPSESTEIGSNETRFSSEFGSAELSSAYSDTSILTAPKGHTKRYSSLTSLYSVFEPSSNKVITNDMYRILEDLKVADKLDFWRSFSQSESHHCHVYNSSEMILLHWLEYHFNKYATVLWGPKGLNPNEDCPQSRRIRYFDFDLNDGLVLIVITCVYCPYLIPYLMDIYLNPTCAEQAFHNISKLLKSWNMIKLSFILNPKDIINPNALQMLMLVNYLYEILPSFSAESTLYFKTGLSTTCSESIVVENSSDFPVTYNIIFIGNDSEFFSVPNTVVNIKPHQKTKIHVKFEAKKIALENVTMILNGETPKHHYARSMVFNLLGEPVPSHATTTAVIPAPLYKLLEINLQIMCPYGGPKIYDVYYATEEPNDIRTCKIMHWAEEKQRKVPKRMISNTVRLQFNNEGIGNFDLTICCVTTQEKTFWIIYKNVDVGDFTVKIVTVPETDTKMQLPLTVVLPEQFKTFKCSCRGSENFITKARCPRTLIIKVPCRNDFLWNAVTELMMKIVDERDLPFWKTYLGTDAGIHINKWMVLEPTNETSYDIQKIFGNTVTYKIILENHSHKIYLPSSTTIENVHSLDYHEIPVHIASNGSHISDVRFTMESDDELELRHYHVRFLTKKEYNNDMQPVNVQ